MFEEKLCGDLRAPWSSLRIPRKDPIPPSSDGLILMHMACRSRPLCLRFLISRATGIGGAQIPKVEEMPNA